MPHGQPGTIKQQPSFQADSSAVEPLAGLGVEEKPGINREEIGQMYKIYDYDADGNETFRGHSLWMDDMFPDHDDPERLDVERILQDDGRCWVGGGASPLVLIIKI